MDEYRGTSASRGVRLFEELMRFLPDGMTANAWAVRAGVSRTIWADLRRHGNPSRRTLEKLLGAAGSSLAEFEALRVSDAVTEGPQRALHVAEAGSAAWRSARLPPVPLIETAAADEWGRPGSGIELSEIRADLIVGRLARPPSLAGDKGAYAVSMVGEAMWPRFRAGRQLLVSPAAAIEPGDDVLVRLQGQKVLIRELVRRSPGAIQLRQFNPDVTFAVGTAEVTAVHKVLGEAV